MKIMKATNVEKKAYAELRPVYPLFGYVHLDGHKLAVEYLGEGKGEPNYEVLAPSGLIFLPDGVHTLLGTTQRDIIERLQGNDLREG